MAGSHRANAMTIHILRTSVIQSNADIKRPKSYEYRVNSNNYNFREIKSNSPSSRVYPEPHPRNLEPSSRLEDLTFIDHDLGILKSTLKYQIKWQININQIMMSNSTN